MYTQKVIDHFMNPRNKGKPKDYDAIGKVGNPICGDVMYIYIKVNGNKIKNIGWETMGCAAAIATSSMITELAKGKTLEEAEKITKKEEEIEAKEIEHALGSEEEKVIEEIAKKTPEQEVKEKIEK